MMCPACSGEVPSIKDRQIPATCDDCYVENSDYFSKSEKLMNDHCSCHAAKHDKEKVKKIGPLSKQLQNTIDVNLKKIEKNQNKAKLNYEKQQKKEYDEQMKYAEEHPR
jgi:NMD protein affecting ribosome stability and mRNA decay